MAAKDDSQVDEAELDELLAELELSPAQFERQVVALQAMESAKVVAKTTAKRAKTLEKAEAACSAIQSSIDDLAEKLKNAKDKADSARLQVRASRTAEQTIADTEREVWRFLNPDIGSLTTEIANRVNRLRMRLDADRRILVGVRSELAQLTGNEEMSAGSDLWNWFTSFTTREQKDSSVDNAIKHRKQQIQNLTAGIERAGSELQELEARAAEMRTPDLSFLVI